MFLLDKEGKASPHWLDRCASQGTLDFYVRINWIGKFQGLVDPVENLPEENSIIISSAHGGWANVVGSSIQHKQVPGKF